MHNSLALFKTAGAMAEHAGARQAVVARNIANADTPGYQAQQILPFQDAYQVLGTATQRTTRPGHMTLDASPSINAQIIASVGEPSPNGNTVSIEDELLASVAVSREHSRALAIYQHAMTVLRTTLGR